MRPYAPKPSGVSALAGAMLRRVNDADLAPLLGVQWPAQNHRFARTQLERLEWAMFGVGDWVYAYRSPSGRLVARVGPFEPGYGYFVELCERCEGNRYVPRIELATRLEGGGHLAVLEYLRPPEPSVAERFLRHWEHPEEADSDLRALRHEVDAIDEWGRQNLRWWVGIDIGERHVLRSADGNLKVIDLFGWGAAFLKDLVDDPRAFARRVPADQRRYLLEMPDLLADDHPAGYLPRIRAALREAASAD